MTWRLFTVALALALATPAGASDTVADIQAKIDRFELWNACQPVRLLVEGLPDAAGKIGLRKADIETAVRSRLRGARIYRDRPLVPYLYVSVNVVGGAFSILVELRRRVKVLLGPFWLRPEGTDEPTGIGTTWQKTMAGTHGGDAGFILSGVARPVDKFIDEYLRVNADACK